ncbi:hypothetical protein GALMADRAFT_232276 [Galerina marginata CBS 339.88]|uniref:ABC transporter domain-containing protein n=1 Tax=Galerina marginata (strain CBS 339.88) TaxID=685588 RepID=A0A067SAS3_GALM3|nr:hypothetical protein GALMADRAFT_232276 [Galerina marginata CBS 339.88]
MWHIVNTSCKIVGPVGSGKSSLLLGLVGEMKQLLDLSRLLVAYCPQTAWVQNASVRDNILLGQPYDELRYWHVLEQASLLRDLELLADGDLAEIGKKGIRFSGGQKQHINVACALYYDTDIVIMGDPLSARKALFYNAVVCALINQGKAVVFVTHALHFLSYCNYIYTISLMEQNGEFARLDKEFDGANTKQHDDSHSRSDSKKEALWNYSKLMLVSTTRAGSGTGKLEGRLITDEDQTTGPISLLGDEIFYKTWLKAGHGCTFLQRLAFYHVLYAVLGIVQTLFIFLVGYTMDMFSFFVSQNLHREAITHIFQAPIHVFIITVFEDYFSLSTIRTYGEIPRFLKENAYYIDLENYALVLSIANQRWLSFRLDFCGGLLIFFVARFAVVGGPGISTTQEGLVLAYITSLTQSCRMLTRQTTEVENHMNSIERVNHPHSIPRTQRATSWPQRGVIEFHNLSMCYRPGLPNVLDGLSMFVKGGEKIGVVGRTGAGKSSPALALMRVVEFEGGIWVDGVDISSIGLRDLRTKIAIISQDPTIFSGTVLSALDLFNQCDVCLLDALRRSYLVEDTSRGEDGDDLKSQRITLHPVIEAEGTNLSVGQRSLLSLVRALVRGCYFG